MSVTPPPPKLRDTNYVLRYRNYNNQKYLAIFNLNTF